MGTCACKAVEGKDLDLSRRSSDYSRSKSSNSISYSTDQSSEPFASCSEPFASSKNGGIEIIVQNAPLSSNRTRNKSSRAFSQTRSRSGHGASAHPFSDRDKTVKTGRTEIDKKTKIDYNGRTHGQLRGNQDPMSREHGARKANKWNDLQRSVSLSRDSRRRSASLPPGSPFSSAGAHTDPVDGADGKKNLNPEPDFHRGGESTSPMSLKRGLYLQKLEKVKQKVESESGTNQKEKRGFLSEPSAHSSRRDRGLPRFPRHGHSNSHTGTANTSIVSISPQQHLNSISITPSSRRRSRGRDKKRCLVIEDVSVTARLIAVQLHKLGYESDTANSGHLAIQMATHRRYDLILTDIDLNDNCGGVYSTEVIRLFEAKEGVEPALIFGLTAHVNLDFLTEYAAVGMDGCMEKGVILHQIIPQSIKIVQKNPLFLYVDNKGVFRSGALGEGGALEVLEPPKSNQERRASRPRESSASRPREGSASRPGSAFSSPLQLDRSSPLQPERIKTASSLHPTSHSKNKREQEQALKLTPDLLSQLAKYANDDDKPEGSTGEQEALLRRLAKHLSHKGLERAGGAGKGSLTGTPKSTSERFLSTPQSGADSSAERDSLQSFQGLSSPAQSGAESDGDSLEGLTRQAQSRLLQMPDFPVQRAQRKKLTGSPVPASSPSAPPPPEIGV